jgi:hypothetical protein
MKIKRIIITSIAYVTTGIGFYYTSFGDVNLYGLIILSIGLIGVLFDAFYHKLNIE